MAMKDEGGKVGGKTRNKAAFFTLVAKKPLSYYLLSNSKVSKKKKYAPQNPQSLLDTGP